MVDVSLSTVEDTAEYVVYRGSIEVDTGASVSKLQDGELNGTTVTIPVTLDGGTGVTTEDLSFTVSGGLSAEGGYIAKEEDETFILLLWRDSTGATDSDIYVIENEYAYNPENAPNAIDEYAAYSESESALDSIRYKLGRTLAPILDNIKQSRLSNDWVTVLRDDEVVEVAIDIDTPLKLVAISIAVEIRVFIITEEVVDGEKREVVKRFSYAPPFPVTAEGAEIQREDTISVIAPRSEPDEMTMRPFRFTQFS